MKHLLRVIIITGCFFVQAASCACAEAFDEIGSLCELHGVYTDNANNRESYSYNLPFLGGDNTYVAEVNEELDLIYDKIKHSFTQMEKGSSLSLINVSWHCEERNGITSIIVSENFGDDDVYYHFFSLDKDGNRMSNERILDAAGLTADEFKGRAYALIDRFMTRDDLNEKTDLKELWEEARGKTLAEENCNEHLPLFLAADGSLLFCAKCYTIAGAEWYNHLFALSGDNGFSENAVDNLQISLSE